MPHKIVAEFFLDKELGLGLSRWIIAAASTRIDEEKLLRSKRRALLPALEGSSKPQLFTFNQFQCIVFVRYACGHASGLASPKEGSFLSLAPHPRHHAMADYLCALGNESKS